MFCLRKYEEEEEGKLYEATRKLILNFSCDSAVSPPFPPSVLDRSSLQSNFLPLRSQDSGLDCQTFFSRENLELVFAKRRKKYVDSSKKDEGEREGDRVGERVSRQGRGALTR